LPPSRPPASILPAAAARRALRLPALGAAAAAALAWRGAAPAQRALSRASTISSEELARHARAPPPSGGSPGGSPTDCGPIRVIVAGGGPARRRGLLAGLRQHSPHGSTVVFVHCGGGGGGDDVSGEPGRTVHPAAGSAPGGGDAPPGGGAAGLSVQELAAPRPTSPAALLAAGLQDADALVLASCGDALPPGQAAQAADAALLCDLLAVQEALEARPWRRSEGGSAVGAGAAGAARAHTTSSGGGARPPRGQLHVVCLVRSYGLRRTAQAFLQALAPRRAFSFELLIADELAAAALVQVGLRAARRPRRPRQREGAHAPGCAWGHAGRLRAPPPGGQATVLSPAQDSPFPTPIRPNPAPLLPGRDAPQQPARP
jgi:hypothetical protein